MAATYSLRDMDVRRGLQAGADALLGALELQRAGDDAAQRAHRLPLLAQRGIEPANGDLGIEPQMHALRRAVRHVRGRASQASSAVKQVIGASQAVRKENSSAITVRAARRRKRIGRVAVDRVLADVEVEGREIDGAEIVQLGRDRVEVEVVDRRPEHGVELGQAMQHPALELGHVGIGRPSPPPRSRRGCPAGSAACCAAGDRPRPGASGSPGRCAGPRCSRCRPPTGAGCRRRTGRTPPAAR